MLIKRLITFRVNMLIYALEENNFYGAVVDDV